MAQVVKPPVQKYESRWLTINFDVKDALLPGDSLTSINSLVVTDELTSEDVTDKMVEAGSVAIVGDNLKVTFLKKYGGGVNGKDYHAEANVKTVLGEDLPEVLIIPVRED
jgi:hypothetical protein